MADADVLEIFQRENRPFGVQGLCDLLAHKGHKKAAVTRALDALVAAGTVAAKVSDRITPARLRPCVVCAAVDGPARAHAKNTKRNPPTNPNNDCRTLARPSCTSPRRKGSTS